jgi:ketosteroid isomerase-like protein
MRSQRTAVNLLTLRRVLLCVVLLPVAARAQAGANAARTRDIAAIRAARAAQNRAMAAGDADAAATYWTEDVTLRRGLGQSVSGREAYRQLVVPGGDHESALIYMREPTSVVVSPHWPLAFESGTWTGHTGSATGAPVIAGSYSAQWVKRDGRWLIRSEVFVALTCEGSGCASKAAP